MNDEVADALRLERRRQDEAREEHQLAELLDAQARRDADAALGRVLHQRFGQNVTADDFIHRERALSQAAKALMEEMKEHPPERDELDCVLGRAFREAFGDDASVEDVPTVFVIVQLVKEIYHHFPLGPSVYWRDRAKHALLRLQGPDAH